jgi:uncharacterized damage-inducible protein DinB
MQTLADRFRRWYDHEKDCNTKIAAMLASVPEARRADPDFARALAKATHLIAAREIWLSRLGHYDAAPKSWDVPAATLDELPARFKAIEQAWTAYLSRLDDTELARTFEFGRPTGERWRWDVEGILTQVSGHAWYHRGQIATLVVALGGKAIDSDYIFWAKPERIA